MVPAPKAGQSGRSASALPPRVEPRDHHAPPVPGSERQHLATVGALPASAPSRRESLAWPSARRRGHTAARGMRPVVPVVSTSSGSRTLRTRGEVPELMDDAPFTVRMEPITECILPGGKARQTYPNREDDHRHALLRPPARAGSWLGPAPSRPLREGLPDGAARADHGDRARSPVLRLLVVTHYADAVRAWIAGSCAARRPPRAAIPSAGAALAARWRRAAAAPRVRPAAARRVVRARSPGSRTGNSGVLCSQCRRGLRFLVRWSARPAPNDRCLFG